MQAASNEVATGTINSVVFASPNVSGNLIVAFVIWSNGGTVSVTDTRGNAYTAATSRVSWGNGWSAQTFYARNIVAGSNTVRATFSTAIDAWGVGYVHEYSGLDKTSPLDVTASATGTSTAMSSGSATTTNANDLIFGAAASSQKVTSAGTGFTTRSSAFDNRIEDRTVTATGSYAATARQNGTRWVMQMTAFRAAGAASDTTPPTQPLGLTATVVSGTQINLAWTASTDNVGVTGYRVFRNGTQIATSGGPSYSDTGLTPGVTYSYSVSAVDAAGNVSNPSATVSATTTPLPDTTPPSQPTGLGATVVSGSQIDLAWTASSDNVGVTGYRVFRNGSQVGSPTATTFSDLGLTPGTTYGYTVSAVDAAGNVSLPSASVSATTTPTADTTAPTVAITAPAQNANVTDIVSVTASASDNVGVVGVQFYVDGAPVGVEDGTPPYAYAWDTRSFANGGHSLAARARDAAGNATTSSSVTVNVANVTGFQNEILATGLNLPTSMKFLPDGRMLVAELTGAIKVLRSPYLSPDASPFLLLTNVGNTGYAGLQQGIFDFALDPNFATNHYYYVFYTMRSPNRDRLSRFTANASLTGTDLATEVMLYQDPQDANTEHHGGAVMFGNDGKLYFTTGDHFEGSPSQDLNSPRGKLHRINPDGTVPTDNPFYDGAGPHVDSVWALGLRNPYRASTDAATGRMYIGDVGGNDPATSQEEVDLGARGANYGWPNSEGPCTSPCTSPLIAYAHNGRDASVTGGFVYRGTQFPSSYQGNYFYADYAQNWIRRATLDGAGNVTGTFNFEPPDGIPDGPYGDIVYLTEGPDGALYYIDLGYSDTSGTFGVSKIRRIKYQGTNLAPTAVSSASPQGGPPPLTVSFSSAGSTDPEGQPLTYSWTFGDGTSSTSANPTHTYALAGPYTARLTVSDGVSSTIGSPLTISVGQLPVPTILTPLDGATFVAGDVISFSGDATDASDGALPASAYTWTVDFLHDGHVHPGAAQTGIKSGSFAVPTSGHDFSGNTRYRISLSVVNSSGLSATTAVTVWPIKVNLSFATVPAGLTLYLDGIAKLTPFVYDSVPNYVHAIDARDQSSSTTSYRFASWSDGGTQLHNITVPSVAQSYTATFTPQVITAPPAFVQVVAATPQTNQTSVPVTFAGAQTAGNVNLVAIGWNSSSGSVSSVGDSAGNVYQPAAPVKFGSGVSQTIWYAKSIAARAAGTNTVTVTFSGSMPAVDLRAAEYSGVDPVNPIDVTASAAGSSSAASSGAVTTTFANELLFGAGITTGGFSAATGGATTRLITTPDLDIVQDQVVSAVGTYSATASLSGSAAWVMQLVALRAGSAAPPAPDISPPSQPTGLTAVPASSSQINLSWSPSSDNVGVTGYRVFRNGSQVATPSGTAYGDVGLAANTTYSYSVTAVDAAGNVSVPSATVSATTAANPTGTPPAFVQVVAATPQTNQTSVPVTFAGAQTAGNVNLVAIGWNSSSGSVSSVGDSAGNVYQPAAPVKFGSGVSQTIWYAKSIAARAAGTNTVTVTFSGSMPAVDLRAAEYSGVDPVNPIDVTASAAGSSSAASSGAVTTTFANELLFGAGITTGGFSAATGGATTRLITTPDLDIVQDQVVSAVGTYSATASLSGSAAWVMQLVALRGASAAPLALAASAPAASTLPAGRATAPAALAPRPTQAAQARCLAGKTSCVSKKVNELLKCERLASTPRMPTDPNAGNCLDKAKAKFDGGADPAKGCFEKLENKSSKKQPNDCLTFDDTAGVESAIDVCVAEWVAAIDPGRQSRCGAGKNKCLAKLATGVLKCHQAAQTPDKPDDPNVKGCIDKVTVKFNGGENPDRGCFEKLEGKPNNDCGTFDDTATLEAAVNSCVLDFLSRLTSTTTTTTTPPSTTTTTISSSSTAYPLKVSANGRYLVGRDDVPFLMIGDSPQALTVNLSEAEADAFFADRQAAGFNLVWVNLLCATYTGGRADGSTYDGIVPFTTPNDLATPNDAFFTRVDHMLNLAAAHGLVVLLDPAETGSYLSVLNANGVAKARDYGRYLGTRYRNFDNIVWMHGNDFQTWPNPSDDAVVQAVARGIHDTDDRHIHTVELDYLVSGSLDDPTWAPLIQLNASYTYFPTYAEVLTDYNRPNALPTFLVEANYEFENNNAIDLGTPQILRRQEYWSMLSGAAGQLYGNHWTWPFTSGWQAHLDTPGSQQMANVRFLFQSRRWYDLIPDQAHSVVTAGYGTFSASGALGDNDYLTAARTPDGALVMAYMPTRRTITVDMSQLATPAIASWYDPSNGTFTAIAGSPLANTGPRDLTPPGNNADGDGDWVLVLDAGS